MKGHSVSFVVLVLLLGGLLGSVMGSLLETIFGLQFLNKEILPGKGIVIQNFYIIKELHIQITIATILGVAIALYVLFKYGRTM